jgi:hypothetical protein
VQRNLIKFTEPEGKLEHDMVLADVLDFVRVVLVVFDDKDAGVCLDMQDVSLFKLERAWRESVYVGSARGICEPSAKSASTPERGSKM